MGQAESCLCEVRESPCYSQLTRLLSIIDIPYSDLCVQESHQLPLKDEELLPSLSSFATAGGDTDGGGHQEV